MNNQFCDAKPMYDIDTLVFTWKSCSAEMNECDYVASIGLLCEMLNKARPSKLLINYTSFAYPLNPELINWTGDTLFKRMEKLGVDTVSITTPESEHVHENILMLFYETHFQEMNIQIFNHLEKSIDWLSSKKNLKAKKKSLFI